MGEVFTLFLMNLRTSLIADSWEASLARRSGSAARGFIRGRFEGAFEKNSSFGLNSPPNPSFGVELRINVASSTSRWKGKFGDSV